MHLISPGRILLDEQRPLPANTKKKKERKKERKKEKKASTYRRDSNLQPQQASGRRPTPQTARLLIEKHKYTVWILRSWLMFKNGEINSHRCFRSGVADVSFVSRDSAVGIATRYRLDGPGIESRRGRDFPHLCRPALRPTQPPIRRVPGLSWG